MKKLILPVVVIAMIGFNHAAFAYCDDWGELANIGSGYDLSKCTDETKAATGSVATCATMSGNYTHMWHDDAGCHYIQSCATCPTGYHLTAEPEDTGWNYSDFCYNPDREFELGMPIEVYKCIPDCGTCTNCTTEDWAAYGTGYERTIVRKCNCGVCESDTQYRCSKGYYGSSSNGTSGCTRCPTQHSATGTTSAAGTSLITGCYMPANTTMSETAGKYHFTSNCDYTK